MSKHEYSYHINMIQSRVPSAHRRLHTQGTSYIGATKERVKCATEEQVWQKKGSHDVCQRANASTTQKIVYNLIQHRWRPALSLSTV